MKSVVQWSARMQNSWGFALFSYERKNAAARRREQNMVKKLYPLCENHLFSKAYRKGLCDTNKYVAVYALKNYEKKSPSGAPARLGITVNKKLGGAVQRSRVKRIIRAAYRQLMPDMKNGYLIIVAARSAAFDKNLKSTTLALRMRESFTRLGLTVGSEPVVKPKPRSGGNGAKSAHGAHNAHNKK